MSRPNRIGPDSERVILEAPLVSAALGEEVDPERVFGRNSHPANAAATSPETTKASLGERTDWSVTRVGPTPKGLAATDRESVTEIGAPELRPISTFLRRRRGRGAYSPVANDSRPTGSKVARAEAMEKGPRLAWASERGGGTAA